MQALYSLIRSVPQLYSGAASLPKSSGYEWNGFVKEPNKFYNTEKITRKASDVAEYIELFGSSTRDRHARRI